ncbi:DUF1491 family protein [Aquidulcibacter sp.]|uniref:DUF1491 family protein n=1 Tax=Aquidulcibacter sp. TaxID=2052990 RepID=UPI0025C47A38|nr:DUF1491 family protein [Aquidulcibacter sp.]
MASIYSRHSFTSIKPGAHKAMSSSDLRSDIWVQALLRTAQSLGAAGFVVRKGDETAGAVLVKVARLDGTARLLIPARDGAGERIYLDLTGKTAGPDEPSIDAYLSKRASQDQDIWIVEIEDKLGRSFLSERVD